MKKFVALFAMLLWAVAAQAGPRTTAGSYQIELQTNPPVVPVGKADLVLRITDARGMPAEGLTVRAIAEMPGMKMGEKDKEATVREPGVYVVPAAFPMGGGYRITVTLEGPSGAAQGVLSVETGQNTATAATPLWLLVLPWLAVIAVLAFVVHRMRATGQRINLRMLADRQVLFGVLMLAAMLALAIYAVGHFRRPGSMTPLEAQIMEMNMPAPPGVAPVELEPVRRGAIEASVRYSGQARGYEEQEVYARTTGIIEWMPFYAGDRVSRGEVLARLDLSRLEPELVEARAGERTAVEEVGVAEAEVREAQAAVELAHAEVGAREAEVEAAQAGVESAQEELRSARADARYRTAQLERSKKLLDEGALSIEEYQRDRAETVAAEATLEQAQAGVDRARAELKRARSDLESHHAHVKESSARIATAERRVSQAEAGLEGARARSQVSEAERGYAGVRATLDGVVTERLVSPGTLVQPGQAVLRVAKIDPIRLQANVPQADLDRVQVGDSVRAVDARGKEVHGKVTSVAPAVDPTTRQAVVEAVVPNPDGTLLPGAFVRMHIVTEHLTDVLSVPVSAVREAARHSEEVLSTQAQPYVWVAEEAPDGSYTVRRVEIEVGAGDGERISVLSGLEVGWEVVTEGAQYLQDGQAVTAVERQVGPPKAHLSQGLQTAEIRVTENGFEPEILSLQGGVPARLTFLRTSDQNCGQEVLFGQLGIKKELPMNQPVLVELTPEKGKTLTFTCGMEMLEGKLVVR
ncbi:MAG: efflux RND transporter periplasmic adaptor subunit [Armatimonadetes bacterium]|nr:efflux RND transporter periplasmic adaptor subunit [Armatimonadota bacterium]